MFNYCDVLIYFLSIYFRMYIVYIFMFIELLFIIIEVLIIINKRMGK